MVGMYKPNKLEKICYYVERYAPIVEAIKNQKYYDELTENEKDLYAEFFVVPRYTFEDLQMRTRNNLHIKLELVAKPTNEQLQKVIDIVAEIIEL